MERPTTVKVGPFDVKIVEFDKDDEDMKLCFGAFDPMSLKIYLRPDFATKMLEVETLIHEVLHSVYWIQGIKHGPKNIEEHVVHNMSVGLTQVWRDNPNLISWINYSMNGFA